MKKLIVALMFLSVSGSARAWEFARNPDRFPSVGLNVSNENISGRRNEIDQPSPILTRNQGGPISTSYYSYGADIRLPASDQITFTLFADSINTDTTFTRVDNVYKQRDKLDGYRYGLGVRLYFSK